MERASGKKHKVSDKEKAFGAAKARQKRAAAWVKKAKDALAQRTPPTPLDQLEAIMIGAEEFTWAGEDMDDVRRVASKVSIAIAFQRELAVLKGASPPPRTATSTDAAVGRSPRWTTRISSRRRLRGRPCACVGEGSTSIKRRIRRGNWRRERRRRRWRRGGSGGGGGGGRRALRRRRGRLWIRARVRGRIRCEEEGGARRGPSASHGVDSSSRVAGRGAVSASPADAGGFAKALADGEDLEKRVVAALAERPNPNPKRCVSLVAEVARGPLEVTSARRLKESVAAAHAWSEKVRKALPGRRHRPARADLPRLQDLAALRADAAELPVQPNDLSSLDAACEETTAWASRSSAFLATSSAAERSLDAAEELLREGLELPTSCDEVDQLEETVLAARHWVEETQKADESDAKIERLAELLERGGALEVRPEEVDALAERVACASGRIPRNASPRGNPNPRSWRRFAR